jgi:hypothetical protein
MPSIFIWKADAPNTSKKTIRYYSGSNWVLEENDYSSKSYIYLEQIVISESDNSVITFNSKDMHQDWVGTELLEVTNVPYEMVKSDAYGTLEKVGDWMRFTLKNEIEFKENNLKSELLKIKKWMNNKTQPTKKQEKQHHNQLDHNKIKLDFQEFLIKYNVPSPTIVSALDTTMMNISSNKPNNRVYNKNNTNTSKFNNNKRKY